MKKEHIMAIAQLLHILAVVALIVIIFLQVHWAAGLLFAWMAVSFAGIVRVVGKDKRKLVESIKALDRKQNKTTGEFNRFIDTINSQAAAVRVEMNTCRECEEHGEHGIRPGSIHNRAAKNCLMHQKV